MASVTGKGAPRRRRVKAEASPTTPDPIEIAMEAEAADVSPDSPARRLLVDQGRLVRWQIASERAGFALKALVGVAGLAVAVVLAAMTWRASQANGLVIEPLAIPPDLAQSGLSGQVVANKILDRMTAIQAGTDSVRKASTFSRAWEGGIKVEIPQTGVTLAELDRELRSWLGHEQHLSGEVVRTADGFSLTVRSGLEPGKTVRGTDIDALIDRAAEASFDLTQPYRYAVWLRSNDRMAESTAIYRRLTRGGTAGERAFAHLGVSSVLRETDGPRPALTELERAAALEPGYMLPPLNMGYLNDTLGHPEVAIVALRRALANADDKAEVRADRLNALTGSARGTLLMQQADFAAAAPVWAATIPMGPQGATRSLASRLVQSLLALHEVSAAERVSRQPDPSVGKPTGERALDLLGVRVRLANARRDWSAAIAAAPDALPILTWRPGARDLKLCQLDPQVAWALANAGDSAAAQALVAATPLDCYGAVIFRGRIAALAGDAAAADHWFGEAVRMAPSVGLAPSAWAEVLLARGDATGALRTAGIARTRSPHFADGFEVAGEALLAQGDAASAAGQFAEAAKYAPRWGRLHLKWGEALAKLGKTTEARAKWTAAAGMDLAPSERAELAEVSRKQTR